MNKEHQAVLEQQLQLLSEQSKADGVDPIDLVNLTGAMIQVVDTLDQLDYKALYPIVETKEDTDEK